MRFVHTVFSVALGFALLGSPSTLHAKTSSHSLSTADMVRRYQMADGLRDKYMGKVSGLQVTPHWLPGQDRFWYEWVQPNFPGFVVVDCKTGAKTSLFDEQRLTAALAKATGKPLAAFPQIYFVQVAEDGNSVTFDFEGKQWTLTFADYSLTSAPVPARKRPARESWNQSTWPPDLRAVESPDHKWTAAIQGRNIILKQGAGDYSIVSTSQDEDYYSRLSWAPDSKSIVATRVIPGDRKSYMYIEESPLDGGPPVLHKRLYDRPGDKIDTFHFDLIHPDDKKVVPAAAPTTTYGDMPELRWTTDGGHFTYEAYDRGYSRFRVFKVDAFTGKTDTIIDDHPSTFVDSTSQYLGYLSNDDMVWRSERDGWGQLYYVTANGVIRNRITTGQWVVRSVLKIDEKNGRLIFAASGIHPGEDPYYIHYYSVGLDGSNMVELTPELGNHDATLSPDGQYLVDTYSTVANPPHHTVRNAADGALVADLGVADDRALLRQGWKPPQQFVAKGRDGKTDIYGIVYRPTDYSPSKKYPVIEDIYAGPQDSFVPKSFSPYSGDRPLAELGFIVVQIDGMGTRNRSKAFQDVAYKNLKDAGFPDRILWIKALAATDPSIDLNRVGIFGTSAGGQNAAAAVIFHPEFYKVSVASCGCHDNRLDKLWWNEQWMGYPIGPQYSESSNIDNAAKMKGHLMLFVGEMDTNVPPESTFRLANALERDNKEFQLVIITGSDHTAGGPYGEHKRRDYFIRNLLGVEPPPWSENVGN